MPNKLLASFANIEVAQADSKIDCAIVREGRTLYL
jgi:hypothetical protein